MPINLVYHWKLNWLHLRFGLGFIRFCFGFFFFVWNISNICTFLLLHKRIFFSIETNLTIKFNYWICFSNKIPKCNYAQHTTIEQCINLTIETKNIEEFNILKDDNVLLWRTYFFKIIAKKNDAQSKLIGNTSSEKKKFTKNNKCCILIAFRYVCKEVRLFSSLHIEMWLLRIYIYVFVEYNGMQTSNMGSNYIQNL